MPLYLAPYIGTGVKPTPFRPRASDQPGWSAVDLRPDASVSAGYALLWLPVHNPDPLLRRLADTKRERLTDLTRNELDLRLDIRMTGVQDSYDLVRELLLTDHSDRICKPVKWSYKGEREIWLGGERWAHQTGGPTDPTTVDPSDNFNRANETPLGGNWTQVTGSASTFNLTSNEIEGAADFNDKAYYWNADTPADDHWCEADAGTTLGSATDFHPLCRCATGAMTFYGAACWSTQEQLLKYVSGSYSLLANITTSDVISGDTIRCEAEGSTIRWKKNGIEQTGSPATDTSITSGRWGIFIYDEVTVDNWQGGTFAVEVDMPAFTLYRSRSGQSHRPIPSGWAPY